ncbi:MAG TPA: RecQ family ATP-dependent DNA helicase [Kofleriaceae bacterium]|nr:RecQ family ATP-dependent DNA helicase [Kofleriaceae bacterium]
MSESVKAPAVKTRSRKAAPTAPPVPVRAAAQTTATTAAPTTTPVPLRIRPGEEHYSPELRALVEIGRQRMGIKSLRPGQAEALEHILRGHDVVAVMPTGSGKSLLYQLPSLLLPGLTVVVSPLIALIKDQIDKMKALGVAVARIDSTLTVRQKREMLALAAAPGGKLLLTTPERMADPDFRQLVREAAGGQGASLFVVDEAHCVSQWGHDFRPSYLVLRKALEDLGRPPVLATTATAPPHVREDILHQLGMPPPGGKVEIVTTTFDRPNLHYEVIALPGDDDKNRTLVTLLKKLPRPGIVYCATVKKVEELYESLHRHGIPVAKYHGRLTKNERDAEQQRFMAPKSELVMIATNAFGLGVDKRDIRYVMHYHVPGSLEQYAQEAGRGGRDDKPARCVLLFSPDDVAIQEYFLKGTYPTRRQVRAVFKALEAWGDHEGEPPTLPNLALGARVGVPRTRTVLSLLKDEGFVTEEEGGLFQLTSPPPDERMLNDKAKQYEARRIADRQRLDALLDYVRTPGCRSQVILAYLGEIDPPLCGRCDNCLRSKEAALAAAREASLLEDGVIRQLREEDQEDEDSMAKARRQVRARLVRIDAPVGDGAAGKSPATSPAPIPGGAELERLIAEQKADEEAASGRRRREEARLEREEPATGDGAPERPGMLADGQEGDDDLADEEWDEADEEDDDEDDDDLDDDEEDDEDDDEDDEEAEDDEWVEAINKTAAAIAEEGLDLSESEIMVLARKRVPKPPRKKKLARDTAEVGEGKRKRRRRRRKRRVALPPKSAFTTPVLVRPVGAPQAGGGSPPPPTSRGGGSGPLVEYVRGPMRINMTPVASATPNDVAPSARKQRRRPRGRLPGAPMPRSVVATGSPTGPAHAPRPTPVVLSGDGEAGGKKRKRRRRRRKRGAEGAATGQQFDAGAPVNFFSVEGQAAGNGSVGPNGQRRKRRRRRRRGRGGSRTDAPGGAPLAQQGAQTQNGAPQNGAPQNGVQAPPPAESPSPPRPDGTRDPD